ncbi:MAG: FAD-dependent thymidylate synthase [bacterium]
MATELIWATPNAEQLIVKMARVSNPSNENNMETAPGLLRYLIKHKHWSPFEMASMCVKINTERDISAQILRHRSFSFQEFSTRYAVVNWTTSLPELRRQDRKNRQNSFNDLSEDVINKYNGRILDLFTEIQTLYGDMVEDGIAKETARRILPLCTNTSLYMSGTLRSWIHYLQLRCDVATQLEHRLIANEIKEIFTEQFPVIAEAAFN